MWFANRRKLLWGLCCFSWCLFKPVPTGQRRSHKQQGGENGWDARKQKQGCLGSGQLAEIQSAKSGIPDFLKSSHFHTCICLLVCFWQVTVKEVLIKGQGKLWWELVKKQVLWKVTGIVSCCGHDWKLNFWRWPRKWHGKVWMLNFHWWYLGRSRN